MSGMGLGGPLHSFTPPQSSQSGSGETRVKARCWHAAHGVPRRLAPAHASWGQVPCTGGAPGPYHASPCPAAHASSSNRNSRTRTQAVAATPAGLATDQGAKAAAPVHIPLHWEQQMKSAPLGKRRVLQRYCQELERMSAWEPVLIRLTDQQLREKTGVFKSRLAAGQPLDSLLCEAFAVVREASRRVLGMRHFDSQMVGGMVLHSGAVAEMSTGEGKTLVATLPAYLNALTGRRVHVVTVNDYLATRDSEWMGKVFTFLGLTCAAVNSNMTPAQYKAAYSCDVTYVTGQELGFAYLRDNTAATAQDLVLPSDLHYAIVDEADSILIDESRNPLIISMPVTENEQAVLMVDKLVRPMYEEVSAAEQHATTVIRQSYLNDWGDRMSENVRQLMERDIKAAGDAVKAKYYKVDLKARSITLTPHAINLLLQGLVSEGVIFSAAVEEDRPPRPTDVFEDPTHWGQLAITAFKAYELYSLGKQYIVRDQRVILIDENTGRLRDITRWQDGLHQAVEAKERVPIKQETLSTASITFQVFFKFYSKLAGMTGTAAPAAAEFFELYKLKVVQVPTNKPVQRTDLSSRFYFDPDQRVAELCRIVESCWLRGRPVLIGTTSVQQSEAVLQALMRGTSQQAFAQQQQAVQVLNAKPEKVRMESQVVAQAGLPGCVTIATNMAGRGTDIILGGSAEGLTKLVLLRLVYRQMMTPDDADALPALPYLLRAGPLGVYDSAPTVSAAMEGIKKAAHKGLPFEVHVALMGAMLLADAEVQKSRMAPGSAAQGLTYDQVRQMAAWTMDRSEQIVREGYERIRSKFEGVPLSDLEFSVCVAPVLSDVLLEREATYINAPKGQVFALKAAVMLRAWLDRQCAGWGAAVRKEGGLLVIGMSLQESRRVELQLRGRAGRQGDPGTTIMMYDIYDPYIAVQNSTGIFEMVRQMDKSSGDPFRFVDGPLVDTLVSQTQRSVESYFSNARLEMKRYDEIVDDYRRSVYSLRKLILLGTGQQCTQVLYMFIQAWVDQLVESRLGSGDTAPLTWLTPSLPLTALPLELRGGGAGGAAGVTATGATGAAAAGASGAAGAAAGAASGGGVGEERVSPWEGVMRALEHLVNPSARVGHTTWEFRSLKDGVSKDEGVRKVLQMMGVLDARQGGDGAAGDGTGGTAAGDQWACGVACCACP